MSEQAVEAPEISEAPPTEQVTDPPAPVADAENTVPEKTPEEVAAEAKADEHKKLSRRERQRQRDRDVHIAEKATLEAENRMLKEQLHGRAPPQEQVDAEPKREDFEDIFEYQRAVTKYDARQETERLLKQEREDRQGKDRQSTAAQADAERARNWQKREAEYAKANPDYEERVTEFLDSGAMEAFGKGSREYVVESGPALVDYLATHPEDAERIAVLSPLRQIAELGKLEIKLEKAPPKPSAAPAPARPIATARSSGKDINKMSAKEIEADMIARKSKWARG